MRQPHDRITMQRLARLGCATLAVLLLLDLATTHEPHFARHGLKFDTWPLFYPALGFFSTLLLVIFSKSAGLLLSREEAYYARR